MLQTVETRRAANRRERAENAPQANHGVRTAGHRHTKKSKSMGITEPNVANR